MKELDFAEQKISIVQTILALTDESSIYQIQNYLNKLVNSKSQKNQNEFLDTENITFEEWNKQFDGGNLDSFMPEYGMKLRDFRMKIYKSEKELGLSKKEFVEKVNNWK
jgi:hypothetical protein